MNSIQPEDILSSMKKIQITRENSYRKKEIKVLDLITMIHQQCLKTSMGLNITLTLIITSRRILNFSETLSQISIRMETNVKKFNS